MYTKSLPLFIQSAAAACFSSLSFCSVLLCALGVSFFLTNIISFNSAKEENHVAAAISFYFYLYFFYPILQLSNNKKLQGVGNDSPELVWTPCQMTMRRKTWCSSVVFAAVIRKRITELHIKLDDIHSNGDQEKWKSSTQSAWILHSYTRPL